MRKRLAILIAFTVVTALVGATEESVPLAESEKKMLKITEQGFIPDVLRLARLDGSVFFVNETPDSLLTLEIRFDGRRIHCLSQNLKVDQAGNLRTAAPIAPHDFVISCFPQTGSYLVTASGIGGTAREMRGTVIVEGGSEER